MIRERKSTRELCMSLDAFKRFGFKRACKALGLRLPPRKDARTHAN